MKGEEFHIFLKTQIEEIEKYKWIESEKVGYDIGMQKACHDWIGKFAKQFREDWEKKNNEFK